MVLLYLKSQELVPLVEADSCLVVCHDMQVKDLARFPLLVENANRFVNKLGAEAKLVVCIHLSVLSDLLLDRAIHRETHGFPVSY